MSKMKNFFGDFLDMAIATNDSMAPVKSIFVALEVGFEIFERLKNFTLFRNNV